MRIPEFTGKSVDQLRVGIVVHEKFPELRRDETCALRLRDDDIQNLVTVPRTGFSHERFQSWIELSIGESEGLVRLVDSVAGKGPGRFFNVGFGIMPFS